MPDIQPSHARDLMHEIASVATLHGSDPISVRLVDVSLGHVRFVSSEKLVSEPSAQLSMRFTLPGNPRLHFAMVQLSGASTHGSAASSYDAQFVRTDPKTVDHIMRFLDSTGPREEGGNGYCAPGQTPSPSIGS